MAHRSVVSHGWQPGWAPSAGEEDMEVSGFRRVLAISGAAVFALGVFSAPAWAHWKGEGARSAPKARPADNGTEVSVTTIAKGLNNPRGLTFGPWGALYVAEAGNGAEPGSKECIPGENPEEQTCVGFTSGVSRIDRWGAHKVVSGLVSLAEANGSFALGTSAVAGSRRGLRALEQESADGVPPEASKYL